jgi:hypothetical protein
MGLLYAVCKHCKEELTHFNIDNNDIACKKCGKINTAEEIDHSTTSHMMGYRDGKEQASGWLKSWMGHTGRHNSLQDWYNDLYRVVFNTKEKPKRFKPKVSMHAEDFLLTLCRLKKNGMEEEQYKRLCKQFYEILVEIEEWEEEQE